MIHRIFKTPIYHKVQFDGRDVNELHLSYYIEGYRNIYEYNVDYIVELGDEEETVVTYDVTIPLEEVEKMPTGHLICDKLFTYVDETTKRVIEHTDYWVSNYPINIYDANYNEDVSLIKLLATIIEQRTGTALDKLMSQDAITRLFEDLSARISAIEEGGIDPEVVKEIIEKYLDEHGFEEILAGYMKTEDAEAEFAKKEDVADFVKEEDLADYAKKDDLDDYMTKEDAEAVFAKADELANYVKTVNGVGPDENGNVNVQGGGGSGDFQTVDGKPMWTDEFLASGKYEQEWAKIYDMRLADGSMCPAFGETIKWTTTLQTYTVSPVNGFGRLSFDTTGVNITFYDLSTRGFPNNKIQLTVDGEVLEYEYNTPYFVGKDSTLKFDLLKKEGDDWVIDIDNDNWAYKGIILSAAYIDSVDVYSEVSNINLKAGDIEVITRPTFDTELAKKADKSDNITNIYVTGDGTYRKDGNRLYVTSPVINDNNVANIPNAGLHYGMDMVSLDTWEDIISNKFYELNPLSLEYVINNIFEDGSLNYRVNLAGRQLSMKVPIAEYPNTDVSLLYKRNDGFYNIQRRTTNSSGLVYFTWYDDIENVWFKIEPYADATKTTIVEDYDYGSPVYDTVLSAKMQAKAYIKDDDYVFGNQDINIATKDEAVLNGMNDGYVDIFTGGDDAYINTSIRKPDGSWNGIWVDNDYIDVYTYDENHSSYVDVYPDNIDIYSSTPGSETHLKVKADGVYVGDKKVLTENDNFVKTVNGIAPDEDGNVNVQGGDVPEGVLINGTNNLTKTLILKREDSQVKVDEEEVRLSQVGPYSRSDVSVGPQETYIAASNDGGSRTELKVKPNGVFINDVQVISGPQDTLKNNEVRHKSFMSVTRPYDEQGKDTQVFIGVGDIQKGDINGVLMSEGHFAFGTSDSGFIVDGSDIQINSPETVQLNVGSNYFVVDENGVTINDSKVLTEGDKVVKTVNGKEPDANGNVNVEGGGSDKDVLVNNETRDSSFETFIDLMTDEGSVNVFSANVKDEAAGVWNDVAVTGEYSEIYAGTDGETAYVDVWNNGQGVEIYAGHYETEGEETIETNTTLKVMPDGVYITDQDGNENKVLVEGEEGKPNYDVLVPDYDVTDRIASNGTFYYMSGSDGYLNQVTSEFQVPLRFQKIDDKLYANFGDAMSVVYDYRYNVTLYVKSTNDNGDLKQTLTTVENVPILTQYLIGDITPFGEDYNNEVYIMVEVFDGDDYIDFGNSELGNNYVIAKNEVVIPIKEIDGVSYYDSVAMKYDTYSKTEIDTMIGDIETLLNNI